MNTKIVTITPEVAKSYLEKMRINRKARTRHVETLALEMVRGKWSLNGETIKFNTRGHLIDGQHRLLAVIQSNVSIESYVVFDLSEDSIESIDLGLRRSPGDIFTLEGYGNSVNLCAALRWVWRYEHGFMVSYPYSPSIDVLKETLNRHPEIKNSLSYGTLTTHYITRSLGSALHCLFAEKDIIIAEKVFGGVGEGEGLRRDEPVFLLRKRLTENMQAKAKLPAHEVAAIVIKAFNAYREGTKIRNLRWRSSGESVEAFPTIL